MISKTFWFDSEDGTKIFVYNWLPDGGSVKGVVQIAHGMAETAARYERFAKVLTDNGYIVYANDHRGHGKTAGSLENVGYLADSDGFDWMVKDVYKLTEIILEENKGLPLFLFGHSMGSFVTQRYIMLHGDKISGAILSGSNGPQKLLHKMGVMFAKKEIKKFGRKVKSEKLNNLSFGSFNNAIKDARTDFDWLSRDEAEVDKYIQDPYCGGVFTAGFFYDFLKGYEDLDNPINFNLVPKSLPVYIFSGAMDPVGVMGKGVGKLYQLYKKVGLENLSFKLYPGGRHEMLNEINRDEVMKDVVNWLDKRLK